MAMSKSPKTAFELSNDSSEKRYLALNAKRLRRVYDSLTARQQDFLDALPLLFHINHALLPGYVSKDTPWGIASYSPSQTSVQAVRQLCRSFEYDRRSAPRFALRGLYMMGSPGTIAYSRSSDVDMWLVHDPAIDDEALAQLHAKAHLIEAFAATLDLEVHFFVFDAERFRSGEDLSLSDESSGSSQHYLLLDEFYRSSLLVAGLPPLWWRVPACYENDYEAYIEAATERRLLDPGYYVDFGGLPTIPAEEFFGAAVWHLYKSIDSPYKSVIKLLLMEAYAAEFPDITLLSMHYKRNVESNNVDLNAIDPYILMYTKIEEHLIARNDTVRLEVLRRCFYLKGNVPVDPNVARTDDDWRVKVMQRLVQAWAWGPLEITRLNTRGEWGLDVAIEERRDLTNTLKDSYAMLSQFARNQAGNSKITQRDLHVLGRKLYAAFEKKPSKIEIVTRGICTNPAEPGLSLHEVKLSADKFIWLLYPGTVTPDEAPLRKPIKRSGSAAEIVLWCHLNRLADDATNWHVFTSFSRFNGADIKRMRERLEATMNATVGDAVTKDLVSPRRVARVVLLVNVGVEPTSGDDILTSDRNDPLAYGGRGTNLVQTVDLLFSTTWNEAFAFRYEGPRAVLEAVTESVLWIVPDRSGGTLPDIETHCFSAHSAAQIATRVGALFTDAIRFILNNAHQATPHIVIQSNDELHHLKYSQDSSSLASYASQALLIRALSSANDNNEQRLHFDSSCSRAGFLPALYRHNRPGTLQIFAHQTGPRADVFLLDERGLLLVNRHECHSLASLLEHYRRFLGAALPRCEHALDKNAELAVETFGVVSAGNEIVLKAYSADPVERRGYLSLRVLADADSNGHQQFTIYAGHREFSTWEHGASLFTQVAEFVQAQRATSTAYPIYITDLDLSTRFRDIVGVKALRPYDLLSYKKRIEFQLTRALHNVTQTQPSVLSIAS
jgi:adenylate cyclase class 1